MADTDALFFGDAIPANEQVKGSGAPRWCRADDAYFPNPLILDCVDETPQSGAALPPPPPSLWARALSFAFISTALIFTVVTLLLEVNMYRREDGAASHVMTAMESSPLLSFVLFFIMCGLADCGASLVALLICLVLTAAAPHRVMRGAGRHRMKCLYAAICTLACCSSISIGVFAVMRNEGCCGYPTPLAVPVMRTVFFFLYFGLLAAVGA